jgi:hypothetical protein
MDLQGEKAQQAMNITLKSAQLQQAMCDVSKVEYYSNQVNHLLKSCGGLVSPQVPNRLPNATSRVQGGCPLKLVDPCLKCAIKVRDPKIRMWHGMRSPGT